MKWTSLGLAVFCWLYAGCALAQRTCAQCKSSVELEARSCASAARTGADRLTCRSRSDAARKACDATSCKAQAAASSGPEATGECLRCRNNAQRDAQKCASAAVNPQQRSFCASRHAMACDPFCKTGAK